MPTSFIADAVICGQNSAATLPQVLERLPRKALRSVVMVDRDSTDGSAGLARDAGCQVIRESGGGYGAACHAAIAHLESLPRPPDAVVFVAADGTDPVAEIDALLEPICGGRAELVIGAKRNNEKRVGERMALGLIKAIYRYRFGGMSGFRAIRFPALVALAVADRGSGWDAEMQVKAVKLGLQIVEVEVGVEVGESPKRRKRSIKPAARVRLERSARMVFRILRHSTTR